MSGGFSFEELMEQLRGGNKSYTDEELEEILGRGKKGSSKNGKNKQEARKVRSRRIIKLLFEKCPLCDLAITLPGEEVKMSKDGAMFELIQFGSNPDDTGYESYKCSHCRKFFMFVIGDTPIVVTPNFTVQPNMGGQQGPKQGPQGQGQPQQGGYP